MTGADTGWTAAYLRRAGAVLFLAALTVGVSLGRLFTPDVAAEPSPGAPSAPADPDGALAPEIGDAAAPEIGDATAPEIGDAAALGRTGDATPAPDAHVLVVEVSVTACGVRERGSGFVIDDGLLVTAAHLVGDAGLVRIDHRGRTVTGEVRGVLADGRDIALVELDAPLDAPLPAVAAPALGAPLTLVGHPEGGPRTSLVGPIVTVAPEVAAAAGPGEIVGVDAPVRVGMSGGPALAVDGSVVGAVVASEQATDTALVVALPDAETLATASVVPGRCPTDA